MLNVLHDILKKHPSGLSEYQLIEQLRRDQHPFFVDADLNDPLSLFRSHFMLFNALYQLRDQLRATPSLDLQISALMIRLQVSASPAHSSHTALQNNDPLRTYYLDLSHLQETDRSAAETLLYGSLHSILPPSHITAALIELGIEQPLHSLSKQTVQKHYRQLVSLHHPDRGGCTERLQRINQAMESIRNYQQQLASR